MAASCAFAKQGRWRNEADRFRYQPASELREIDAADEVFGIEPNRAVLHQAYVAQMAQPPRRQRQHQEPRRSRWFDRQDSQAEGPRPLPPGFAFALRTTSVVVSPSARSRTASPRTCPRTMKRLALRSALSEPRRRRLAHGRRRARRPPKAKTAAMPGALRRARRRAHGARRQRRARAEPHPGRAQHRRCQGHCRRRTSTSSTSSTPTTLVMTEDAVRAGRSALGRREPEAAARPERRRLRQCLRRFIPTPSSCARSSPRRRRSSRAPNKYVFEVDLRANKNQIKEAIQLAFNVRVVDVNTMKMKGKPKRFGRKVTNRPDWKKAIVTLVPGRQNRTLRGDLGMPIKQFKPTSPGRRDASGHTFSEITKTTPEKSLTESLEEQEARAATTRAASPSAIVAVAAGASTASSTGSGTSPACRRRSSRLSTTRTARRASPSCSTPTAKSATSSRRTA